MEKKSAKIVLCGYYGRGNFGDEVILSQILKKIRTSLAGYRLDLRVLRTKSPTDVLSALRDADVFVFGGGSLLQNATSDASLFYYVALIGLARLSARHLLMLSNGIGPIKDGILPRRASVRLLGWAAAQFDEISVRDRSSLALLNKIIPSKNVKIVHDPAFCCFKEKEINQRLINSKYFVYVPCSGQAGNEGELVRWLRALKGHSHKECVVLALNPREDLRLAKMLASSLSGRVLVAKRVSEVKSLLCGASFVISQRYHGTLFASGCGSPVAAVSDDPKMRALCLELGVKLARVGDDPETFSHLQAVDRAVISRLATAADSELSSVFAELKTLLRSK